jgi:hypothetical protein
VHPEYLYGSEVVKKVRGSAIKLKRHFFMYGGKNNNDVCPFPLSFGLFLFHWAGISTSKKPISKNRFR